MLLVPVHGPPRVYGGVRWPGCREPVHRGRYVVLNHVVVLVWVCWLRVVPRRWWVQWQGLVVVVGVPVVHVMVWLGVVQSSRRFRS